MSINIYIYQYTYTFIAAKRKTNHWRKTKPLAKFWLLFWGSFPPTHPPTHHWHNFVSIY